MARRLVATGTVAILLWGVAILATPWLATAPARGTRSLAAVAYLVGAAVCHQRPDRSFHLRGVPLPVCARCTGLYLGAAVGAIGAWSRRGRTRRPLGPRRQQLALLATALPIGATWLAEQAGGAVSSVARGVAAVPFAAVAAWLVGTALLDEGADEDAAYRSLARRGAGP